MDDAATPVAASAPRVAESAGPVAVSRAKGRPHGKVHKAPVIPYDLLPSPTADQVRDARAAAGQTQLQAAAVIGARQSVKWAQYEGGRYVMPAASWTWYLLATGQHPSLGLKKKRT
jgi:hypothetical protein